LDEIVVAETYASIGGFLKNQFLTAKTLAGLAASAILLSGCGNLTNSTTGTPTTTTTTSTTTTTYEYLVYPNESANTLQVGSVYLGPGSLTLVGAGAATYSTPVFVKAHPNNYWIYEANQGSGNIIGFSIDSSAGLTQLPSNPYASITGVDSIAINPAGTFLFAAGTSTIQPYQINTDGSLTALPGSVTQALPASNCSMAFTTTGSGTYLNVAAGDGTANAGIYTYQVDPTTAALTLVSSNTAAGLKFSGIATLATGNIVYATLQESSSDGEVVSFTVNTDGSLSPTSTAVDLAEAPGELALSNSGLLYVGGTASNLFGFTTDVNGGLTAIAGTPYAVGAPINFLNFDPTQTLLYGASTADSLILGFQVGTGGVLTTAANSPYSSSVANPGHFDSVQYSF
jgi:hypothetical protein